MLFSFVGVVRPNGVFLGHKSKIFATIPLCGHRWMSHRWWLSMRRSVACTWHCRVDIVPRWPKLFAIAVRLVVNLVGCFAIHVEVICVACLGASRLER